MKVAIITGASSGMGKEFVKTVAAEKKVDEIWAIARNEDKLSKLKEEVAFPIRTFSVDVSNRDAVKSFGNTLAAEKPDVIYLINSAGHGKFTPYDGITYDESLAMIDSNCTGLVAMTYVTLPYMREGAHVINLGSSSAFQPLPYQNIYGSTKAFVLNYSRALNRELKERKITVTCVCPSWVNTDFFITARKEGRKGASNFRGIVSPDKVVKKAMKDVGKGKDISVVCCKTNVERCFAKIMPTPWVIDAWMKQQKFK